MKRAVVFSGAGLSKESGIPTFRDAQTGLWENHSVEEVASASGWRKNPDVMLRFYADRMTSMGSCEPNAAHRAIAELQSGYDLVCVTQNIDDLLERAGVPAERVIHLHGDIAHRKCEFHHSVSMLDGDTQHNCRYRQRHSSPVLAGELCPDCGGRLRPDVVWFEEPVHRMTDVEPLVPGTDVFIVVGTSAVVYPAAGLLTTFLKASEKYFIDVVDSPRLKSYTRLIGPASEMLPPLVRNLLSRA